MSTAGDQRNTMFDVDWETFIKLKDKKDEL